MKRAALLLALPFLFLAGAMPAAHADGTTNFPALADYPGPACPLPAAKPGKGDQSNSAQIERYNEAVETYNTSLRAYVNCLNDYVDNSNSDIDRIRRKVRQAVRAANTQ